jgi:hypothetical protein
MHPADEIGKALSQARGLLSSVLNCYDKSTTSFATGTSFVAEAIFATEDILVKAGESLTTLYADYDLNVTKSSDRQADESEETIQENETTDQTPTELPIGRLPFSSFGLNSGQEQVSRLAHRLDNILESLPPPPPADPMRPEDMVEQPAQNYDELLEKLTAMADSAAFHARPGSADSIRLLPVLESLRADVLRMRSAA